MPPSKRRKTKQQQQQPPTRSASTRQSSAAAAAAETSNSETTPTTTCTPIPTQPYWIADEDNVILASAKKRGVYECDYCHCDISQLPRIRCAVCDDFDLCLDCFTASLGHNAKQPTPASDTTTHPNANAVAHYQSNKKGGGSSSSSSALLLSPKSAKPAPPPHNPSLHGYRVCDSTRFPIFPTAKQWGTKAFAQMVFTPPPVAGGKEIATQDSVAKDGETAAAAATEEETAAAAEEKMSDAMEVVIEGEEDSDKKKEAEEESKSAEVADKATSGGAAASISSTSALLLAAAASTPDFRAGDDPKLYWTVEEDLRLLEGIANHGLGNWVEIAETVAGQGSVGKTPKRCMERYLDDYLGRYGHILPPYTLLPYEEGADEAAEGAAADATPSSQQDGSSQSSILDGDVVAAISRSSTPVNGPDSNNNNNDLLLPRSKRRGRTPGGGAPNQQQNVHNTSLASRKRYKVIPTESIEGYGDIWPQPYLPFPEASGEVGRDHICKSEQAYVKLIGAAQQPAEAEAIKREWAETKLGKPHGPTVLPPSPEQVMTMSGSELAGFMPRRGDFDMEWENDAEEAIGDMEFLPGDSPEDKQLKLKVLAIYNSKLDKREARKHFVISRKLWDYRKLHHDYEKLPADERDLVQRMRLFERFHTPREHKIFLDDILRAKRLRKEIAKLQMYRRLGLRTLVEAEKYELDKARRQFHKNTAMPKDKEDAAATSAAKKEEASLSAVDADILATASTSLWRQYRTSDRRVRKSVNRGAPADGSTGLDDAPLKEGGEGAAGGGEEPMDVEGGTLQDAAGTGSATKKVRSSLVLSPQEAELCSKVGLTTEQYAEIKKVLIQESLTAGLLDKEGAGSSRRALIKMDVERRGNLLDFFLRAGWVSTRLSHIARSLPSQQQAQS